MSYTLGQKQLDRIEDILNQDLIENGVRCVFLIDMAGNIIANLDNGEKQHEEFVNSRVEFDRIRAEAGEAEYASGKKFDGLRAAKVYEYYSYFDDSYLPLAFDIKKVEASRFTTWKTVVNQVLAAQTEE